MVAGVEAGADVGGRVRSLGGGVRGPRGRDWVLPGIDRSVAEPAEAGARAGAGAAAPAAASADVAFSAGVFEVLGVSGRALAVRSDAGLSGVARSVVGLSAAGGAATASVDRARGKARAAAHVTAIEEARYPRMPLILDIVILICPSGI
ncbi:hypothetical protein GCM10010306_094850 [Streptomyces umbrinus]|nr:hypothetical protein GCM10010306_094850 [Streptomyces umbrinus]GHH59049.1 hypothetical protein GCM10018775_69920 [Streptomyces umbrinus]